MNQKNILITILIAIVVGGTAFFAGMKYQQGKSTTMMYGQNNQGRMGMGRLGRNGMMATFGKVVSSDSNSVTVQLTDGSSKIVNLPSGIKILKTDTASAAALTNGTNIGVFGSTNSDGSITAQNIQINPQMRMRPQQNQ